MAYSQDDIDALEKAMARGVQEVQMDGERVRFRSLDEMERQLGRMKRELSGATRSRKANLGATRTGWR